MSDYDDDDGRRFTREEAEDMLESEARKKDFWEVSYPYDNKVRLGKALDALYNTIPGNKYEVDYMENQNGTRLIIRCVTCAKELTSYDPFITHEKGKPHKKVRQQQLNPKDPNLKGMLRRQPHNLVKGIFPKKSLEDRVDLTKECVLGMQFVYKEVIKGKSKYTCQLCRRTERVTAIKTSRMFEHVKSRAHIKKYMEVKFGYIKTQYSQFFEEVENIERMEGKIHSPIVDFTKQLITKEACASANYEPIRIKKERYSPIRLKREPQRSSDSGDSEDSECSIRKRESRWSDRSSDSDSNINRRVPSPKLFPVPVHIKAEPVTPPESHSRSPIEMGPTLPPHMGPPPPPPPQPIPPPPPPVLPPKIVTADKWTATENSVTSDFIADPDGAKVLLTNEAQDQLLDDKLMQQLLHQSLWVLNDKLTMHYKESSTFCFDDHGNCVSKAAECSERLKNKHLVELDFITNDPE